jgi:hypothetical protein
MSDRSRKHKKRFPCGHRGFGRYCHYCADRQARKERKHQQRQTKRQQWQSLFFEDGIDLRHLPKSVVQKSRTVLRALEQGQNYWQLSGKRLHMMRNVIKIPVTRRYRLLCRDDGNQITPVEVISHEDYNPLVAKPKRLWQRLFSR